MSIDEEREFGSRNLRTEDEQALSQVPAPCDCSVPCPHQHPTTWKCKWDGLLKPEGACKPHTFEHRPVKIVHNGFYSSIRCMVAPNDQAHVPTGAERKEVT